jgi:two-component system response regulator RegA
VPPGTLLLVEDDEIFREQLARALRARGFAVTAAGDFESAQDAIRASAPDFALVDFKLPGKSGLDVISEISERSPRTRTFLLTGSNLPSVSEAARQRGAVACLRKPLDADEVVAALGAADDLRKV